MQPNLDVFQISLYCFKSFWSTSTTTYYFTYTPFKYSFTTDKNTNTPTPIQNFAHALHKLHILIREVFLVNQLLLKVE